MIRLRRILLALPGFEALCRRLTRGHVRVLMYHRVAETTTGPQRHLPSAELRRHLAHLAESCRVVDPDTQARFESGRESGDGRPLVVLTVDDGYSDFRDVIVPALQEFGMPVTLFVTTGFVDGESWMWWDKVSYILEESTATEVEFTLGAVRLGGRLDDPWERGRFWSQLVPALRFVPYAETLSVIDRLARQLGVEVPARPPARYAALSWDELRDLLGAGVNLGGHTRTHPILSRCTDEHAAAEISGSRDDLAERLGTGTTWFAYPQGGPADYTETTTALVRDAGYRGSYVAYCDPRLEGDAFTKVRYHVDGDFLGFRWMVCGAEYLSLRLRAMLGRSTGVSRGYWRGADMASSVPGTGPEGGNGPRT